MGAAGLTAGAVELCAIGFAGVVPGEGLDIIVAELGLQKLVEVWRPVRRALPV
jgi:hypothetical protein